MSFLDQHIDQIRRLCSTNSVKSLFAFGSVIRDDFGPESDVDLIVDIGEQDPTNYADKYFNLKFELEKILRRQIDLLENQALKNPYLKQQIDKTKILIYGG